MRNQPTLKILINFSRTLNISSSSSSFYLNQATWPIDINKRHTDRQIDSISKRKKKKQYKMYNKTQ